MLWSMCNVNAFELKIFVTNNFKIIKIVQGNIIWELAWGSYRFNQVFFTFLLRDNSRRRRRKTKINYLLSSTEYIFVIRSGKFAWIRIRIIMLKINIKIKDRKRIMISIYVARARQTKEKLQEKFKPMFSIITPLVELLRRKDM